MPLQSFDKAPDARRDFSIDWSDWLAQGETVSSSSWDVPAGISLITSAIEPTRTTVRVEGGTLGQRYVLSNTIGASGGESEPRSIAIWIKEQ